MLLKVVCEPLGRSKKTQRPIFYLLLFYSQYFLSGSVFGTEPALVQEADQATSCCDLCLVFLVCQVRNPLGAWTRPGEKNDFAGGARKDCTSHALVYGKKQLATAHLLHAWFWAVFGVVHVIGEKRTKRLGEIEEKFIPPQCLTKCPGEKDYNWLIEFYPLSIFRVCLISKACDKVLLNSSECLPLPYQPLEFRDFSVFFTWLPAFS